MALTRLTVLLCEDSPFPEVLTVTRQAPHTQTVPQCRGSTFPEGGTDPPPATSRLSSFQCESSPFPEELPGPFTRHGFLFAEELTAYSPGTCT